MKKIRILALLLAVLMLPLSLLVACNKDDDTEDECADGHEWNKKEVTIEKRTCTTSGIKERTCKVCKLVEKYEWKPDGHTIQRAEWIYDEDATCTSDGHETRYCALCTYSETRVKPGTALGHTFVSYILSEDGYSETAVCDRCSVVSDTRLVGFKVDCEGARDTLSYSAFTVYTPEGVTDYYKTEGEGATLNSYLQFDRTADIGIGDHGYGIVFTPGYERLKTNRYVVEYDIKINKDNTGDLVLLSGKKEYDDVNFLTYDADTHTIGVTYGALYTLKDADYDRWMKLSLVLNDVEQKYEFYIDNKLVMSGIDYEAEDYYPGMNLKNFKIAMTHEVGVASTFAVDNIDVYMAVSPRGYNGTDVMDPDYALYVTDHNKDKIMYKVLGDCASHTLGEPVDVPASCTSDGYSYKQCSVCGGSTEYTTTAKKLDHDMKKESEKESTCVEYGAIYEACTLCGIKTKTPIPMKEHVIDTTAPSYKNIPATCTSDGIIVGECNFCHTELGLSNGEYKYGHNIVDKVVTQEANCIRDGYSTGKCINPGCNTEHTIDEVPAYGHTMKTQIVDDGKGGKNIENFCLRCRLDEFTTSQPLSIAGKFPSVEEMKTALGTDFYGGTDGNGFTTATFDSGSKNLELRFTNDGSSSVASKATEGTNSFLRVKHTGTGYLNWQDFNKKPGEDVVVEISLRLPASGKAVTGKMNAAHREPSGHNVVFTMFTLNDAGEIVFTPAGEVLGKLTSTEFSKLSFVVKIGKGTVDAYFNGELKFQNVLMKAGDTSFLPPHLLIYEFRFLFDSVSSGERGIDADDMYMYKASLPRYITNPFLPNTAETNYDISKNIPRDDSAYIPNKTDGVIGAKTEISSGKGFRAYVENVIGANDITVSALHCIKGDRVANIPGATKEAASEVSTNKELLKSNTAVIYNEIKFNAGSFTSGTMNAGSIVLAQGLKYANSGERTQVFLKLENGAIKTGDGKQLYTVKQDEWISYNVIVNEAAGTYDVYINGICLAMNVACSEDYAVPVYSRCGYSFMIADGGEFDFYMANTGAYSGAIAPVSDVNAGAIEKVSVPVEVVTDISAVKFYADQSVSTYYDYVGEKVLSGDKLVELSNETAFAKKDAVSIGTVDGKTVLKTGNYKTNNLKAIEFKNLVDTRLATGKTDSYNLTGYQYLTLNLYVEKTEGYNLILKLTTESGDYFQMRIYIISTGWQTFNLPLFENPNDAKFPHFVKVGTGSGSLADVTSLRIEFEGDIAGNGSGGLMDGTEIAFEKIGFANDTYRTEIQIGENIDAGKFCEIEHSYIDVDVYATCETPGYTTRVCENCGHIAVKGIVPAKEHTHVEGDRNTVGADCFKEGVVIDHITCDDCEDDYYAITSVTSAKEHNIVEGTCTECGKQEEVSAPAA